MKKWVDWGAKQHKKKAKALSGREKKYYDEIFKGNFNIFKFHLDLNPHIESLNLKLEMMAGFTSKDIKALIDENKYPLMLIEPQYINADPVEYENETERKIRGEPEDFYHFIALHGYDDDGNFFIYDSDLKHKNDEVLSADNIRCQAPFGVLKRFSEEINNRLYWFELRKKEEETTLTQY